MRFYLSFYIVLFVLILIDIYSFKAMWLVLKNHKSRKYPAILFWLISIVMYVLVSRIIINPPDKDSLGYYSYISIVLAFLLLFLIPKIIILVFHFIEDFHYLINKLRKRNQLKDYPVVETNMGRRTFITKTGIAIAVIPFASFAYGIFKGRFNFTVYSMKLFFSNLPKSFEGIRIVQFSDFHLGSFAGNYNQVEAAIDLINKQNADLLVFTGDLVNNSSHEIDEFLPLLKSLKAKYGKYSILGNHDYGDYAQWDSETEKKDNFDRIISLQHEAGFEILRNENRKIFIDNEYIQLLGLENWGHPPFPQYGNLSKAMKGIEPDKFTLLLSHDPAHWDAEVLKRTNIDLTLAGHTHGFQFGVEIAGIKWSPAQLRYPRWGGLYTESLQQLYVNRGIGYIGVAARVGIAPEITVLELCKKP